MNQQNIHNPIIITQYHNISIIRHQNSLKLLDKSLNKLEEYTKMFKEIMNQNYSIISKRKNDFSYFFHLWRFFSGVYGICGWWKFL